MVGCTNNGTEIEVAGLTPVATDKSIHLPVGWDEGLPTEKPFESNGGKLPNGSNQAGARFKIPSGVSHCHWVVLFDDSDGNFTWGGEGTLNL